MTRTLWLTAVSILLLCGAAARGADGGAAKAPASDADKDQIIRELQDRLAKVEARLAELEQRVAALPAGQGAAAATGGQADAAQREKLQQAARARMRRDADKYTLEQIREAEQLYQVANRNWRSPEAKESLRRMIEKYPDLNRTGCAVLYLGQMAEDAAERERLLSQAIEKYSDCYYGNGVQVGGFARLLLGHHYREAGQPDKAKALFEEIRKDYADAIDHRGRPLVAQIPSE